MSKENPSAAFPDSFNFHLDHLDDRVVEENISGTVDNETKMAEVD